MVSVSDFHNYLMGEQWEYYDDFSVLDVRVPTKKYRKGSLVIEDIDWETSTSKKITHIKRLLIYDEIEKEILVNMRVISLINFKRKLGVISSKKMSIIKSFLSFIF